MIMMTMTADELKPILAAHATFLRGEGEGQRADLSGAHLRRANLEAVDLREADLRGAKLREAKLRGANLGRAWLRGADLRGADLRCAYLITADLRDADLRDADLRDADLRDADLRCANLRGAVLGGTALGGKGFDLTGAKGLPAADPGLPLLVARTILADPSQLHMGTWHCGTAHCLGGWAVALTPGGSMLEDRVGTETAAHLLLPSASHLFYSSDEDALAWAHELVEEAEAEAKGGES